MDDLLGQVSERWLAIVRDGLDRITAREREVLRLAIAGETAGSSAQLLGISVRTVELHRQSILIKLQVKNLTQAVRVIAIAAVLRAPRRLHVRGVPRLRPDRTEESRGVKRSRADLHVVGLQ